MTEFGDLMRRLMAERGISLHRLAKDLNYNVGYLCKVRNGTKPAPRELAARVDEALSAGGELAALAPERPARRRGPGSGPAVVPNGSRRMAPEPEAACVLPSAALDGITDLWDDLMRRRAFLYHSGTAAMMALATPHPALPGPPDPAEAMAACADLTAAYRRLEGMLGPGAVYAQAAEHQRHLMAWLPCVRDRRARRQLGGVAADASLLLAWLCFDLDDHNRATLLYRQSFELARDLGDVNLAAFTVGRMSRTLSESGRHRDALRFAEAARHIADRAAIPQLRSWLAVTRAYVHACLGDERSCRQDLDAAAVLLRGGTRATLPYLAFYGPPYVHKWSGHALVALSERKAAPASAQGRAALDRALTGWSRAEVRESGEVLAAAARARLAQHEVDEAVHLTARACDVVTVTSSPRIMRYVTDLRQQLQPWRHTKAVIELDEHLPPGR